MIAWDNTRYCCASVLNIADNYLHITQDMFIRQGRSQTRGLMDFCYTAWPNTNTIQRKTNTIQTQHKYTILDFCKAAVPGADPPRLGQWARQGRQSASEGKLWKSGTDAAARSNLLPVTFCPPVVLGSSVVVFSRITGRNARERGVREGRGRSQQREARCAFLILLLLKTMCTAASVTSSSVWPNTWSKVEARSEKGKQSKWVWSEWEASSWTPFPPVRDNPTLPLSQKPTHFHPLARPNLEVLLESVWESILGIFKAIAYVLRFLWPNIRFFRQIQTASVQSHQEEGTNAIAPLQWQQISWLIRGVRKSTKEDAGHTIASSVTQWDTAWPSNRWGVDKVKETRGKGTDMIQLNDI